MRARILQHVPFEGPGRIEPWFRHAGYEVDIIHLYDDDPVPAEGAAGDPLETDFLVVMGGPMSVNDEDVYPWLRDEKAFIRRCIEAGRPVLGVCLGAQLIASAMGARVYPNEHREIGWFPVQAVPVPDDRLPGDLGRIPFRFPPAIEVFHWHGDTFELPAGSVLLAESPGCRNQAFQLGRSAVGLQFHLEMTPEGVDAITKHCADEISPGPWVQTAEEMRSLPPGRYERVDAVLDQLLSYLVNACD